jgi:hypothetical protein
MPTHRLRPAVPAGVLVCLLAALGCNGTTTSATPPPATDTGAQTGDTGPLAEDAAGLAETSADAETDTVAPAQPTKHKYLFGSLINGKVAMVNATTLKHVQDIGAGHNVVHGAAILPGQEVLYYPNMDTESLDKIQVSPTDWKVVKSTKIPRRLGIVRGSRNGAIVVVSPGIMPSIFSSGEPTTFPDGIVVYDTATDSIRGIADVKTPNSLAVDPTGTWIVEANSLGKYVAIVNANTLQADMTISVPGGPKATDKWLGPVRVAITDDARWIATADFMNGRISLLDRESGEYVASFQGEGYAHDVHFSPDGSKIYAVSFDAYAGEEDDPDIHDKQAFESKSALANHRVYVIDRATMTKIAESKWDYLLVHVAGPPDSDMIYASGAFSSFVVYRGPTYEQIGVSSMSAQPMPLMTIIF